MSDSTKKTFQEIIKANEIEIPIIQRDYAQGRKDGKIEQIRNKFLNAIFKALETNQELHLDFVYGSIECNQFIPLDGQQRLTTLFLLHWYFGKKEGKHIQDLKKFNYATRASSREFCQALVDSESCFSHGELLSGQIKDFSWFLTYWEKDPTVQSMLTMIDAIHNKAIHDEFKDIKNGFERLQNISFEFLQMEHFGLTDDLYIKMNARGKALTDFENFKASFQKHIGENHLEDDDIPETDKFSHKIDTVWLDLFWKYRDKDNLVDNQFMKFISRIAMQAICLYEYQGDENTTIQNLYNNPNDTQPEHFTNQESFDYLKQCFDLYSDKNKRYDNKLADELESNIKSWLGHKKQLFKSSIEYTSYHEQVLFFAQTQYLLKLQKENENFNGEKFQDWMRVVQNIVHHSTIDSPRTFRLAINLINELVAGCFDIYNHLATSQIKSGFASKQVQQEVLKAKLIVHNAQNRDSIFKTEDTNFCQGDIEFALYCIDFDKENLDSFNSSKLLEIQEVLQYLEEKDHLVSNELRAALFTIKDGWFFCKFFHVGNSYKHIGGRRFCIVEDIQALRNFSKDKDKNYLKELIFKLINKDIKTLLKDFQKTSQYSSMKNWQQKIINEPDSLNYGYHRKFIAVTWDYKECYLLNSETATLSNGKPTFKDINSK